MLAEEFPLDSQLPSNDIPFVILDSESVNVDLSKVSQSFIDSRSRLSVREVIQQGDFSTRTPGKVQTFTVSESHWYRYALHNKTGQDLDLILKTNNRSVLSANLYQINPFVPLDSEDFIIKQQHFGDFQNFDERSIQSRKYNVYLTIPASSTQHIYLKWQDTGQSSYSMELVDLHTFFKQQMFSQALSFLTLGFAMGMLVYNLNLLWQTRERVYLSYSFYIIAFSVFLEIQNGSAALFWESSISVDLRPVLVWTLIYIVLFTMVRLTSQMLLLDTRDSEKYYWLNVLQAMSLVLAVSTLFLPYSFVEYFTYAFAVASTLMCLFFGVQIYRHYHDPVAKTFVIAFSPLLFSVMLVSAIYGFGLSVFPYLEEVFRIAFCLNLVLLSNALADQIKAMNEKQQFYEAKLMAVKANESAKSDFFGKMGHEIRTPLNGIIGTSELLKNSELSKAQEKYVDVLQASSKSLMHLVNNLVDYSKVESGKMELREQIFDMKALLLDIEKIMGLQVLEKRIPLLFDISQELPREFFGDENCIKQILLNFLSNAYKFTENGYVTLKVTQLTKDRRWPHKRAIRFEVIDTGLGIPKEQVESIFEDFTQVYSRTNQKYDGAGLGLAICRELSILLGGEIHLESELGEGSRFYLDVPLKLVIDTENEDDFKIHKNQQLSSSTLLIVDNCVPCSELLKEYSSSWGMKVGLTHTLEEALKNIRRSSDVGVNIDLLLVEYSCLENQTGGNHFIKALSRHSASKDCKVLMLVSQKDIGSLESLLDEPNIVLCQRQAYLRNYEIIFEATLFNKVEQLRPFSPYWLEGFTSREDKASQDKSSQIDA